MKLKITKDFIIGVLCGVSGTLYFTAKKFADALAVDKEDDPIEEMVDFDDEFMAQ